MKVFIKSFLAKFRKHFTPYPDRMESHEQFERLKRQKRNLAREYRFADEKQKKEIHARIQEIDKEMDAEMMQHHLYADEFRKSDLRRYERLRGSNASAEVLTVKNLEINTASHKVYVSGREVSLTAKEYELLIFRVSNPNIVFSKEHLLESIWGQDFYGEQATVPVHIQKLRKKIGKDPSNPEFIEALWGTGYRFNS